MPDLLKLIDKWGGPETYPHMAAGWAVAFDSPFAWTKQVASSFGGTRNGMVVHWPKGIQAKGELRTQFGHVIDVAPTILEAAGLPEPKVVNGTPQIPIEGVSIAYTFDDAQGRRTATRPSTSRSPATGRSTTTAGSRARSTSAPWEPKPRQPLAEDIWELYDVRADFSLANDLAAKNPEKLDEMQALFLKEAERYHVLPIDDRAFERLNADAGRPSGPHGRPHLAHAGRGHDRA